MEGGSNIAPLNDKLGAVYGLDRAAANIHFGTGRLTRVRGRVVHEGARPSLPPSVMLLLNGIYLDVLCLSLGLLPPRRAQAVLDNFGGLQAILDGIR